VIMNTNLAEKALANGVSRPALAGNEAAMVRAIQTAQGSEACFRSDKRLVCSKLDCEWRDKCCRLIAAWRR